MLFRSPRPPRAEISLPARIEARHLVTVEAQVTGSVQEFLADVGQEVHEGQLLARIGNTNLENARENAAGASENAQERVNKLESAILAGRLEASRARADAERSRAEMERAEKARLRQQMLHGEGATPRLVWEKAEKEAGSAKSEFDSLETLARHAEERVAAMLADLDRSKKTLADRMERLEEARAQLEATQVHAPVDGLVVARRGEVGKDFGDDGNLELFRIAVDTALLRAVVDADPSALARLAIGGEAMLFFADIPGEGIAGTVAEIRDGQALIDFTSPSPFIRPGMTAQARLTLE